MNNLNMCCYEDFLPWNNNFMLRSNANIFVYQILVQGCCDTFVGHQAGMPLGQKFDPFHPLTGKSPICDVGRIIESGGRMSCCPPVPSSCCKKLPWYLGGGGTCTLGQGHCVGDDRCVKGLKCVAGICHVYADERFRSQLRGNMRISCCHDPKY